MDDSKPNFEFKGKYIIEADLHLVTALHIGGTEEGFEIGGMDNPVIKDSMTDIPYIPGSSLKGKIRSMLEWAYDLVIPENKKGERKAGPTQDTSSDVGIVFGIAAEAHKGDQLPGPTRLTVCDAYPDKTQIEKWETYMGDGIYTELKTENSIDRLTSAANPRPMERVPAKSVFKTKFIFDVYHELDFDRLKVLFEGMMLLEDSTLGGGGSRGSGRVEFKNIMITSRHKGYYLGTKAETLKNIKNIDPKEYSSPKAFVDKFKDIWA